MRKTMSGSVKRIVSGAAAAVLLLAGAGGALAGEVKVKLQGVEPRGGTVLVSLQRADEFMQPKAQYGAQAAAPAGKTDLVLDLGDVPPGEYAVVAMHDANGDWQMQRQSNGAPQEGWAMSGKAPMNRMPAFEDVKVTVTANGGTISARMIYP